MNENNTKTTNVDEKEKDINLQIAKRLKKQLEKNGVKVYMTRENDVDLSEGDGNSG